MDEYQTPARIPVPSLEQLRARTLAAASQHPSGRIGAAEVALGLAMTAQAPKLARTFSAAVLEEHERAQLADTTALLVSELVTNALLHARTPLRLELRLGDQSVRVDVVDESSLPPAKQRPDPEAESGRGLLLVDKLSDRWGWNQTPTGKRVWFELDLGQRQPRHA
jgi:anti-sigma regulatory factor (Ser/Thr protein kinase)